MSDGEIRSLTLNKLSGEVSMGDGGSFLNLNYFSGRIQVDGGLGMTSDILNQFSDHIFCHTA